MQRGPPSSLERFERGAHSCCLSPAHMPPRMVGGALRVDALQPPDFASAQHARRDDRLRERGQTRRSGGAQPERTGCRGWGTRVAMTLNPSLQAKLDGSGYYTHAKSLETMSMNRKEPTLRTPWTFVITRDTQRGGYTILHTKLYSGFQRFQAFQQPPPHPIPSSHPISTASEVRGWPRQGRANLRRLAALTYPHDHEAPWALARALTQLAPWWDRP